MAIRAPDGANKDGSVVTDNVSFTLNVFLCFNARMTSENTAAHDLLYSHSLAWSQYISQLNQQKVRALLRLLLRPTNMPNNARSHKNRVCGLYCLYVLNMGPGALPSAEWAFQSTIEVRTTCSAPGKSRYFLLVFLKLL